LKPGQDKAQLAKEFDDLATIHGGYWRYGFVDHSYLYNLYFPPAEFFEMLQSNIHALVQNYPVAQTRLAGLLGELIEQAPEHIVVGNGAAELIKIISAHVSKKLIVPTPTFNEYVNAAPAGHVVEFSLDTPSYDLDVDKFVNAAKESNADVAVVVTPNNPTSKLIPKSDLLRLIAKLAEIDCMLVVDESFVDFVEDRDQVTLERDIKKYPNLTILKSMSKAYGICGLRIGYILTANTEFAEKVRSELPIWNLNGFAENFLETSTRFQEAFVTSCVQVRKDRDEFYRELSTVKGLTPYRPDANFVFCRISDNTPDSLTIAKKLFVEHNIYIKHCQSKAMQEGDRFLRIACRTPSENSRLVSALDELTRSYD